MKYDLAHEAPIDSGHFGCPGCGEALGLKLVLHALEGNTVMVIPACCASYVDGMWPHSAARIPILHVAFGATASAASGVRAALDLQGKRDVRVLAWAGGGGVLDSEIHALSSSAERNENILYVCYGNESYFGLKESCGYTGVISQDADNGNEPRRRDEPRRNILEVMAAHEIPYCATTCVALPEDLDVKVRKASGITGFKFIQLLTPCPKKWDIPSELAVELTRLAVLTRIFPIYEIEHGDRYTVNFIPEAIAPVTKFFAHQGRFADLSVESIRHFQHRVDHEWKRLLKKADLSPSGEQRLSKSKLVATSPTPEL